jgi:cell wall-associated NlpC family hydrolase
VQISTPVCKIALFAVAAVTTDVANAQDHRPVARGDFGVPLQPFSVSDAISVRRAEPIQMAYNVPRAQAVRVPRASAAADYESDYGEETERTVPTTQTRYAGPIVAGNRAILRNGIAYAPSRAPANVKNAIWAVNTLRGKPYVWGGGHDSFNDYGYDCSGSVSYALHYAGLLAAPIPSSDFIRYGERGHGRWITIYARHGHTFAVIAGLRLDTTDLRYGGDVGPRWYADSRNTRGFEARHPIGM